MMIFDLSFFIRVTADIFLTIGAFIKIEDGEAKKACYNNSGEEYYCSNIFMLALYE